MIPHNNVITKQPLFVDYFFGVFFSVFARLSDAISVVEERKKDSDDAETFHQHLDALIIYSALFLPMLISLFFPLV